MRLRSLSYLAVLLALVYVVFPAIRNGSPAYALSADGNQHFTPGSMANWSASGGCGGAGIVRIPADAIADPNDVDANNGYVTAGSDPCTQPVTATYVDPGPLTTVNANQYITVDIYTQVQEIVSMQIITQEGHSAIVTNNDIILCPGTIVGQTTIGTWYMVFIDLSTTSLFTSFPTDHVQTINVIFGNTSGLMASNGSFLDNLRGSNTWPGYCGTPPPTPTTTNTPVATNTFTVTPTNTPTNSPTPSPTRTPTDTPTNTPTNSPSNTPTSTPTPTFTNTNTSIFTDTFTNTPVNTNTFTNSFTPTPTLTFTVTGSFTYTVTNTFTPSNTFTPTPSFTPSFTVTLTNTPTLTNTFTQTFTPTVTFTPTDTFTSGPTPTTTATLCPVNVYPDPMDFQANPPNNNNCPSGSPCIKLDCIPVGSTVKIFTISLELVRNFPPNDPNFKLNLSTLNSGRLTWDGNNGDGNPVSSGFYLYVVDGPYGRTFGKLAISRTR